MRGTRVKSEGEKRVGDKINVFFLEDLFGAWNRSWRGKEEPNQLMERRLVMR